MVISASQSRDSSTETTERRFALGVGLTNECNLACAFCYRDPTSLDRLSLAQVRAVMKSLPVRSVNLGTGENGMHPDFAEFVSYLRSEPIKLTITSNGYSIEALDDTEVTAFHDIEFSSINPYVPTRSHSRMMNIGRDLRHYLPVPTRSRSESRWCVRWRACRHAAAAAGPRRYG